MTVSVSDGFTLFYPKFTDSRPHVEIEYNDDALSNTSSDSEKNIFIIGSATQGNPNTVYELNSLSEAKTAFGTGDLVNACELIWNPANDGTQSGGTIYALRVENATQGTLTEGSLSFVSNMYGSNANSIGLTFGPDVINDAYQLEVTYSPDGYDKIYSGLGNIFSISYSGTAAVAGYSVTKGANGEATTFDLLTGTSASTLTSLMSIDLTNSAFEYVYQVMEQIAKVPGFSAVSVGKSTQIDSLFLDATTSPVVITGQTSPVIVKAVIGDLLYTTRNDYYVSISASGIAGDVSSTALSDGTVTVSATYDFSIPDAFTSVFLSGATDGSVPTTWSDKFTNTRGNDVYYIVPLTDEQNIHAELKEYLSEQDSAGFQYRAFVGGGYDESLQDTLSRQVALKSPRVALVANSGYYSNLSGASVHIPAYLMAAYVAGVASSLDIGNAVTGKYISLISLDNDFSQDDLDTLDTNGVIAIEDVINRNTSGGFRIVEDVTTYNSTNEPVKNLMSLGELNDFLMNGLRYSIEESFIGVTIRQVSADLLQSAVVTYLTQQVSNGLIDSFDETDITVSLQGNQAYIVCSCAPARTLRNILIATTYTNYTASSSASE